MKQFTEALVPLLLLLAACSSGPAGPEVDPVEAPADTTAQESPCVIPVKERRICTQQYEPVCACNGKTYGNACTATAAGVQRFRPGTCEEPEAPESSRR